MDEDSRTVWCGNLSDRVSSALLHELFLQAGPLERISIPKDPDGRQRNYAFITYVHEETVEYAMNILDGTTLYDRTLRLQTRGGSRPNRGGFETGRNFRESMKLTPAHVNSFESMTNRMPHLPDVRPENDNRRNKMKDLSIASLTGQWSSKNNFAPERFEPYKNDYRHNKYKEMERNHGRNRFDKPNSDHKHHDNAKDYHRRRDNDHRKRSRH